MKLRTIKQIIKAQRVKMGHIFLDQALPIKGVEQIDPFLLIHHWADTMEGGKKPQDIGVGPHPHRGFAPVTFIFKGNMHHRDSLGNSEIVFDGGTQWMHSGKGIIHSERPDKKMAAEGGEFEIIQFWVNVPKEHKMAEPYYKPLHAADTPQVKGEDGKSTVAVVSGEYKGTKGAVEAQTPQQLLRIEMQQGAELEISIPKNYNALLYILNGDLLVNDNEKAGTKEMLWMNNDGEGIKLQAGKDTRAILLAGEPINEPVVSYGPFVMNTEEELMTAMQDYQSGKMGTLNEVFD